MILDTAISSISEETGINRGGIDVEITNGLPVAIKCTLILCPHADYRTCHLSVFRIKDRPLSS